jgi:uncharacterized protein YjbJ (UPF0337 family)
MKSSVENKLEGSAHEVKGKAKEIAGRITKNPDLEKRGTVEKIAGKIERKIGDVKKVLGK